MGRARGRPAPGYGHLSSGWREHPGAKSHQGTCWAEQITICFSSLGWTHWPAAAFAFHGGLRLLQTTDGLVLTPAQPGATQQGLVRTWAVCVLQPQPCCHRGGWLTGRASTQRSPPAPQTAGARPLFPSLQAAAGRHPRSCLCSGKQLQAARRRAGKSRGRAVPALTPGIPGQKGAGLVRSHRSTGHPTECWVPPLPCSTQDLLGRWRCPDGV